MKTLLPFFMLNLSVLGAQSQTTINLYGNQPIPGALSSTLQEKSETGSDGKTRISQVTQPTLTYYAPDKKADKHAAVIICPGGGYGILAIKHEGFDVAKILAAWGFHAFVLKYRLPNTEIQTNPSQAPLQDAQQAIRLVRLQAATWSIDVNKIAVMGFSAGGHLAASASTHFNQPVVESETDCRPNASILIYPVISFTDSLTHQGSRQNLIGPKATAVQNAAWSNELQVQYNTPPAFLVHSGDDGAVPVGNSIGYYRALLQQNIEATLHVYPHGGHGYGMHNATTTDKWMDRLKNWFIDMKWL